MSQAPSSDPHPVLIVDDVASGAMTLDLLCQSLGVATIRAASAAEAADILTRLRPAAIITDLIMLGADGLDLFMIARHAASVPVLVVTASDRLLLKAAGELGESYGPRDLTCASKPVDLPTLTAFMVRSGVAAAIAKPARGGPH
jgi:CheY-like chemotaxis protein